jgi:hypothetical protein
MKLLVVGGCHTYGAGVPLDQSFINRLLACYARAGAVAEVDYYAPVKMSQIGPLLHSLRHRLVVYDMIVIQPGHFDLNYSRFVDLFAPVGPASPGKLPALQDPAVLNPAADPIAWLPALPFVGWREQIKVLLIHTAARFGCLRRLNTLTRQLDTVLDELGPHRERTVLITPVPILNPAVNRLRQVAGRAFEQVTNRYAVAVLNPFDVLPPGVDLWLPDACHLNVAGHQLLANALTDIRESWYRPAPTATPASKREPVPQRDGGTADPLTDRKNWPLICRESV